MPVGPRRQLFHTSIVWKACETYSLNGPCFGGMKDPSPTRGMTFCWNVGKELPVYNTKRKGQAEYSKPCITWRRCSENVNHLPCCKISINIGQVSRDIWSVFSDAKLGGFWPRGDCWASVVKETLLVYWCCCHFMFHLAPKSVSLRI